MVALILGNPHLAFGVLVWGMRFQPVGFSCRGLGDLALQGCSGFSNTRQNSVEYRSKKDVGVRGI